MRPSAESPKSIHSDVEEQAAALFTRRRSGAWSAADQSLLDSRLRADPDFTNAYRRVDQSWESVGRHATSPELLALREHAIARARKASARRWLIPSPGPHRTLKYAAAAIVLVSVAGMAWQLSPYGYQPGVYRTGFGEQKMVDLADHSRIALDARTQIKVRFSPDARIVELLDGQAQFTVAKDPARPFKVVAGEKTIVAVGTVFTVEYVDKQVQVAMVEGRVAVLSPSSSNGSGGPEQNTKQTSVELSAGEELQVLANGSATISRKADIEAATAWREGKVIFRDETLGEAVHRLNRYSRQQVIVDDPTLAQMKVSGVFDSGDAQAFAEAMLAYLPVAADFSHSSTIHLRMK
jgi:transmembrane sensor